MTPHVHVDAPRAWRTHAATCATTLSRLLACLDPTLELGVALLDDAAMTRLNQTWRNKPTPTDVLSFDGDTHGPHLGDIALCVPVAARQATALGHSTAQELAVLCVHAVVHLCGLDHERSADEALQQAEIEMGLLAVLGIPPEAALTRRGM